MKSNLVLVSMLLSLSVYATEENKTSAPFDNVRSAIKESTQDQKVEIEKENKRTDTSAHHRVGKRYQGTLSYGGDYAEVLPQVMLSKFLTSSDLLGLKAGYLKDSESSSDAYQMNLSLQYKRFFSNSFYLAPEVFYLKREVEREYSRDSKYRGLGASLRLGNQWQWEKLTIGCDWIGVGSRLVHFKQDGGDKFFVTSFNAYVGLSF